MDFFKSAVKALEPYVAVQSPELHHTDVMMLYPTMIVFVPQCAQIGHGLLRCMQSEIGFCWAVPFRPA